MNNAANNIIKELLKHEKMEKQAAIAKLKNKMNKIRNNFYSIWIVMLLVPTGISLLLESPIHFLLIHWLIQLTIGAIVITSSYYIQIKCISN